MLKSSFVFLLIIFFRGAAIGQEETDPIDYSLPAPDWNNLKEGKATGWLYFSDDDQSDRLASSSLDGHSPANVSDGNSSTAWSEGVDGPGIGELIFIRFHSNTKNKFWMWGGYGKSPSLFRANNRPKKIRIYLLGTFCHDCTPRVCIEGNFVVVGRIEKELKDINDFQEVLMPALQIKDNVSDCNGLGGHDHEKENYFYGLAIEILSVYKGSKYDDTCITEIMDNETYAASLKNSNKLK